MKLLVASRALLKHHQKYKEILPKSHARLRISEIEIFAQNRLLRPPTDAQLLELP